MKPTRRIVVFLAGLAVICLCLVAVGLLGARVYLTTRSPGVSTPVSPAATTPPPTLLPDAAGALETEMDHIQEQVEQMRILQAGEPVTRKLITRAELAEKLKKDQAKDYTQEEARADSIALAALGLVPPGFDIYNYWLELQTEQILGFYDPDEKTMYVISDGQFGGFERWTYAHEYTHYLQDQTFGFKLVLGEEQDCGGDSEKCAAIQALYEGDAELASTDWLKEYATRQDFDDIQKAYESLDTTVLDHGPAFFTKQFDFTYSAGFDFVQGLKENGGWDKVNAAFKNPPVSTEQILHPGKYPGDAPQVAASIVLTDTLGSDWREVDSGVLGELYTRFVLEEQILEEQAAQAAEGWGGDAYVVSYNESAGQTVLAVHFVWDTPRHAEEFALAFDDYNRKRFGGDSFLFYGATCAQGDALSCLSFTGNKTLWVLGPDEDTVSGIFDLFPFPLGGG